MDNKNLKIIELRAENFKRLHAVAIKPDGGMFSVGGKNGQGKSSVLDAVWAALGGSGAIPDKPVHSGSGSASVFVDLGDLRITRTWSADGKTKLKVEARDGAQYKQPQAILDCLTSNLTFDPLAFGRMKPVEQAATLRALVGLDVSDLDEKFKSVYYTRSLHNIESKRLSINAESVTVTPHPGEVGEPITLQSLRAKATAATAIQDENRKARHCLQCLQIDALTAKADIARVDVLIDEHNAVIRKLEAARTNEVSNLQRISNEVTTQANIVNALVDPDMKAIDAEFDVAEKHNREVSERAAQRTKHVSETANKANLANLAKSEADKSAELTAQLEQITADKSARLAAVKFPIPGLSIENEVVTFTGLPLSQASSAEQLRVSLAIGAALNPRLRVMLVRDGSLLDAESLGVVAEWAQASNMQILIERVGDIGESVGVIIEDGEVKA